MICEYGTELREYEVQYIRMASFDPNIKIWLMYQIIRLV